jgi:hypothetical protein
MSMVVNPSTSISVTLCPDGGATLNMNLGDTAHSFEQRSGSSSVSYVICTCSVDATDVP